MDILEVLTIVETWSIEDRIKLAQELWNRLIDEGAAPNLVEDRKEELDRRLSDDEAKPDDVIPWSEVKAQALSRARR